MDVTTCLTTNCPRPAHSRGLCSTCYGSAAWSVRQGLMTWEELIAKRLALPCRPRGRKAVLKPAASAEE